MPTPAAGYPKSTRFQAIAVKLETQRLTDCTPTFAANAVQCLTPFGVERGHLAPNDVSQMITGGIGQPRAMPPGGPWRRFRLPLGLRGAGAQYASGSVMPELDALLQAAGYTPTVNPSTHIVTYALAAMPSATVSAYAEYGGKKDIVVGCMPEGLVINLTAGTFPTLDLPLVGAWLSEAEQAVETATYSQVVMPLFRNAGSFEIDTSPPYQPIVRSATIDLGLTTVPRGDANAAEGHAGYQIVRRRPTIRVVAEMDSLSNWSPQADFNAATIRGIQIVVGNAQWNTITFNADQCVPIAVVPGDDNGVQVVTVDYAVSQQGSAHELDIVFS